MSHIKTLLRPNTALAATHQRRVCRPTLLDCRFCSKIPRIVARRASWNTWRGVIEDTRQALIEAKQLGIHPFCVTIDTGARDYLPHMYGVVNYTLIDKVDRLPLKLADIYRKLTF